MGRVCEVSTPSPRPTTRAVLRSGGRPRSVWNTSACSFSNAPPIAMPHMGGRHQEGRGRRRSSNHTGARWCRAAVGSAGWCPTAAGRVSWATTVATRTASHVATRSAHGCQARLTGLRAKWRSSGTTCSWTARLPPVARSPPSCWPPAAASSTSGAPEPPPPPPPRAPPRLAHMQESHDAPACSCLKGRDQHQHGVLLPEDCIRMHAYTCLPSSTPGMCSTACTARPSIRN